MILNMLMFMAAVGSVNSAASGNPAAMAITAGCVLALVGRRLTRNRWV